MIFPNRWSRSPWKNMDVMSVGMAEGFPKEAGSKPNVRATPSGIIKFVCELTRKWIKTLAATIE
jgi:hypothetical protein